MAMGCNLKLIEKHDSTPIEDAEVMNTTPQSPRSDAFQRKAFLLILVIISIGFLYVVRHFLLTLFLAAVFTGLSHPLYEKFTRKVKYRPAAAGLTLLVLVLCLVLPIAAVIMVAYQQAWTFFQTFDYQVLPGILDSLARQFHERFPALFSQLQLTRQDLVTYALGGAQRALEWIVQRGANWSLMAAGGLVNFALMLFFMFYFYLDGERILSRIIRWSPLPDDQERALFNRFLVVGRGALKGIFVIGAIQGLLAGLMFWITGVTSPIFLGVLTVFASVIPAFGAGLIWFPVMLALLFTGKFGAAMTVLLVGALVISTVDNLLRPQVVGKDIKMHDVMVLVSTLGGLIVFGLPGFIIGPILAALFLSAWAMFEGMFAKELARNRVPVDIPEL
jgi:predicted PurR-regulated permease PerM